MFDLEHRQKWRYFICKKIKEKEREKEKKENRKKRTKRKIKEIKIKR